MESRAAAPADSPSGPGPSFRGRLVRLLRKEATPAPPIKGPDADADPLLEFSPEDSETGERSENTKRFGEGVVDGHPDVDDTSDSIPLPRQVLNAWPGSRTTWWIVGAGVTSLLAISTVAFTQMRAVATRTPAPEVGKLSIDSRPGGITVTVDGEDRGVTPLTLALRPGAHSMMLRSGTDQKTVPLTILAGGEVSQYFEFAAAAAPVALVGRLSINTEPAGARVQVDGRSRGTAPIVIPDLEPGEHTLLIVGDGGRIERKVSVEPGGATSVMFSLPRASGPSAGWLALSAPFDVQVFEDGDLVSTSGAPKIMLPSGRHQLHLVSTSLGYEDTRGIDISPGKVAELKVEPPKATLSANARPWADLIIDGTNVGQTPIANLQVAIGTHQVIFRHPQLGEERRTIVVTTKGPNRISVDLAQKK
jgi:hypothetical protein